jgi:Domain of unknown function DUF29
MNLDYLLILLSEIEIDHTGQEKKQSLESHLKRLVENIFKLQYWELETGRNYKYWQVMVSNSRNDIQKLVQFSPTLRRYMEQIYPKLYQEAINLSQIEFYIPQNMSIGLEEILDNNYFG